MSEVGPEVSEPSLTVTAAPPAEAKPVSGTPIADRLKNPDWPQTPVEKLYSGQRSAWWSMFSGIKETPIYTQQGTLDRFEIHTPDELPGDDLWKDYLQKRGAWGNAAAAEQRSLTGGIGAGLERENAYTAAATQAGIARRMIEGSNTANRGDAVIAEAEEILRLAEEREKNNPGGLKEGPKNKAMIEYARRMVQQMKERFEEKAK